MRWKKQSLHSTHASAATSQRIDVGNLPFMPSLLFLDGVVASFVPSPGRWKSKTSTASSYPQYILQKVSHCVGQSVLLYLLGRDTIECHTVRSNISLSVINNFIRRTELSAKYQKVFTQDYLLLTLRSTASISFIGQSLTEARKQ